MNQAAIYAAFVILLVHLQGIHARKSLPPSNGTRLWQTSVTPLAEAAKSASVQHLDTMGLLSPQAVQNIKARWGPAVGQVLNFEANNHNHCTGTLVGPHKVLTPVHCVRAHDNAHHNFNALVSPAVLKFVIVPRSREYHVRKVVLPPKFNFFTYNHFFHTLDLPDADDGDLAILLLDRDVVGITSISIDPNEALVKDNLVIVGFGAHGVRQAAAAQITGVYKHWLISGGINRGACEGDSGGPLLRNGKLLALNSEFFIQGLPCYGLSFSIHIRPYLSWIAKTN